MAENRFNIRRIYFYTLVFGVLVLLGLSLLASSSLDVMTDDPLATYQNFLSYSGWLSYATLIISLLLLILASWVHFRRGSGLYYLPVLTVLMVFANYNHIFLSSRSYKFKQYHDMWEGGFEVGFLIGIFQSIMALVLVMLIYSFIHYLRKRSAKTA